MKIQIQITATNKEKELCNKLSQSINMNPDAGNNNNNISGKWGYVKDDTIEINEECIEDLINIILAIMPKVKSLINFVKTLYGLSIEAFDVFKTKWINNPTATDILETDIPLPKSSNNKNSASSSTTESNNKKSKKK